MNYFAKRLMAAAFLSVFVASAVFMPTVRAISSTALENIIKQTPFQGEEGEAAVCTVSSGTASSASGATNDSLPGNDPVEKGFNYFIGGGINLTAVQSAALIGNFKIESGLNPKADNGSHRGIAQWDYADRYADLKKFADTRDPDDLGTQLDFVWLELNGTAPANDYRGVLDKLKTFTTDAQLEEATQYIQDNYEGAAGQATDERKIAARDVFNKYGSNAPGATSPTTSGSGAACGSVGAVDCSAAGTSETSSLSQTRQNVVCLAQAELALWKSGEMKPGKDFFKYESGGTTDEQWCADFVSWVYNEAGYPLDKNVAAGRVPAVDRVREIGEEGKLFTFHDRGAYVPQPGDIVVYKVSWSHVNIVISVNANKGTMSTIGGNEGGDASGTGTDSSVKQTDEIDYAGGTGAYGSEIVGFVSPNN